MSPASAPRVVAKWRPPLVLVVAAVLALVAALPLGGLVWFRVWDNQLVRQAEAELIAQSAAIGARIAADWTRDRPVGLVLGTPVASLPTIGDGLTPLRPKLDLATDRVLPPRPEGRPAEVAPGADVLSRAARLTPELQATQSVTLAGFRILDAGGVVIAGREEIGLSLAHVDEVAAAREGRIATVMRERVSKHPLPPIASFSRGGSVRVFLALPVAVDGRVAAIVLASRTPAEPLETLFQERRAIGLALLAALATIGAVGFLFHRTITRPVDALIARTRALAAGDRGALRPLDHHGTAEFAALSQSFLDMASNLAARSDYVSTFAAHVGHEIKSPLTAIAAAAELLADDADAPAMSNEQRAAFLRQIGDDAARLGVLVSRLRDLARAESTPTHGRCRPAEAIAALRGEGHEIAIAADGELDRPVAMSADTLRIVLGHLVDNAARHGARTTTITGSAAERAVLLAICDDGPGISPANRDRIFDPFFTTRRADGGTGMGLPIVRTLVETHRGTIDLAESPSGACFVVTLPLAPPADESSVHD